MWLWLWLLLILCAVPAAADVTHVNYLGSNPAAGYVNLYDVNGNYMENGEYGDLKQFGSTFYWYTMSADTGWIMGTVSPAQGFRVYSSPDLVNWTDHGPMLDVTQSPYSTECTGVLSSTSSGHSCFGPRMLFNSTTNKYVFFYSYVNNSNFQNIEVQECATPLPPCTYIGAMPTWAGSENAGIFPDDQSADAFVIFESGGGTASIQKLTSDYHDVTGSATDTGLGNGSGGPGEAPWMKHVGGKWMVGNGPFCSD